MNRWRVGEDRGSKEKDRCPLTETPEERWQVISVDFIVELPESHGYDAIMNMVDSVSKRVHCIPTHTTISAKEAALLKRSGSTMDSPSRFSQIEDLSSSPGSLVSSINS
jgi:hypothetical protein